MPNRRPLTREQARAVDQHAMLTLGFPGPVLMENAGRGCVDVMERAGIEGSVVVVAGRGNNAGDGFVIARHLALRGYAVKVALGTPAQRFIGDARTAFEMLTPCHVPILDLSGVHAGQMVAELDLLGERGHWIVDALLGTGAHGAPRPPYDALIDWINAESASDASRRVLAVDLPSGLDCDTGQPAAPTVRASHTCTFVAPKTGFNQPAAAEFLGKVQVVDIGLPETIINAALK